MSYSQWPHVTGKMKVCPTVNLNSSFGMKIRLHIRLNVYSISDFCSTSNSKTGKAKKFMLTAQVLCQQILTGKNFNSVQLFYKKYLECFWSFWYGNTQLLRYHEVTRIRTLLTPCSHLFDFGKKTLLANVQKLTYFLNHLL